MRRSRWVLLVILASLVSLLVLGFSRILRFPTFNLSTVADWATVVGSSALVFVIYNFNEVRKAGEKKKYEEKYKTIKALEYQLAAIGEWTSYSQGGYHEPDRKTWIHEQCRDRVRPAHSIYAIEATLLATISLSAYYFDDEVREAVAWLSQWVSNFNSYLSEIRQFKHSIGGHNLVALSNRLKQSQSSQSLTEEEAQLVDTLMKMYATLHFDIIGDQDTEHLHYWHKRLAMALEKEKAALV